MTKAEATSATRREADTPTTGGTQYVVWENQWAFQERVLEAKDVKELGAETGKRLVWNKANNWRVPRADVPLTDEQLASLQEGEPEFKTVER